MTQRAQTAFLSYCREDSDFALRLAGDLKAAGASVWLDQLDILPGQRWDRAVEDALTNCPRLVVILSPASISSANVMDEVSFALEEQKTVIPVIYQDCTVPFRLRRVQHSDFRQDYARGLQELLRTLTPEAFQASQSAAAGNAKAMADLGYRYYAGKEVTQDYQKARQWWEKAAGEGHGAAMSNLGGLYYFGYGVTRDYVQARQWFEKGAAAGSAVAMYHLGVLYEEGNGVEKDYQQARQWYEKAAAGRYADAMYSLGFLYEEGNGVGKDYQQARLWYEKAAATGNETARERLKTLPQ